MSTVTTPAAGKTVLRVPQTEQSAVDMPKRRVGIRRAMVENPPQTRQSALQRSAILVFSGHHVIIANDMTDASIKFRLRTFQPEA
jgi:hypothetical protein